MTYYGSVRPEEFNRVFDIAAKAVSRIKRRRTEASDELTRLSVKAVRPLAYVVDCWVSSSHASEDEVDRCAEKAGEVIMRIGEAALPVLEDLAVNGNCNLYVNSWAQEMIFRVMGLQGVERQKVCHHFKRMLLLGRKKIWVCTSCDSGFVESWKQVNGKKEVFQKGRGIICRER